MDLTLLMKNFDEPVIGKESLFKVKMPIRRIFINESY